MPKLRVTNQLQRLWPEYTKFKSAFLHPNTIRKQYGRWGKIIAAIPPYADTASDIVDWALGKYAAETVRRLVESCAACYTWAIRTERAEHNPFLPFVGTIRKTAYNNREAFSAEDRDQILQAFQHRDPYYWAFVALAFRTGARNEEVRGLEWKHIGPRFIRFEQAIASGAPEPAPIKTGENRSFPLDDKIRVILDRQRGLHSRWVFPSVECSHMDAQNFLNRHWAPIVKPLVPEKIERYLPPSHTRHTFITLALKAGVPVADVAKLVGNSPDTIWKHYAQATRDIILPDF
jgi:integrase